MHPSRFFKEVFCRTGLDVFEIFDDDLNKKLQSVHPLNFIKTKINLPVYEIKMEYDTDNDNHKSVSRYMVMDSPFDEEYADCWADMYCRDYNCAHPDRKMKNLEITKVERVCDAVLPIG